MTEIFGIKNKRNIKLFTWIFIFLNLISIVLFVIFISLIKTGNIRNNYHLLDFITLTFFNRKTFDFTTYIAISLAITFVYSFFYSYFMYKQHKVSNEKIFLIFSYLIFPWYIGYLQIFGLILGIVIIFKNWKMNSDDPLTSVNTISLSMNENNKKLLIKRSGINLILDIIFVVTFLFILLCNDLFMIYLFLFPLFIYACLFSIWFVIRNTLIQYLTLKKNNKKFIVVDLFFTLLGQLWWFL